MTTQPDRSDPARPLSLSPADHPVLACAIIILVAVFVRTLFTSYIELGGDALEHWHLARTMSEDFDPGRFAGNHHRLRWATNAWPILYASLFGWGYGVYYIPPILFFGLLLVASAFFVRLMRPGVFAFTLFLLVFFGEPMFFRATSNLVPFVFAGFFMMLAGYFLVRAVRDGGQVLFAATAAFFFLAYGAHENSALFVPGACAFVLWNLGLRRGVLTLITIGAYGCLLVAAETVVFDLISSRSITFGRLELLGKAFEITAKSATQRYEVSSILDLIWPWFGIPLYTGILVVAGLVSGVYLARMERRGVEAPGASLPAFFVFSFFFFHAFLLQSIDPVIPFSPPNEKYLTNAAIWAALSTTFAVTGLIGRWQGTATVGQLRLRVMVVALLITIASLSDVQYRRQPQLRAWFWHAEESYQPVRDALRRGFPILTVPESPMRRYLSAWFATELVRVEPSEDDPAYFAFEVPDAMARRGGGPTTCIDFRRARNQGGRWLIACPADMAAGGNIEREP